MASNYWTRMDRFGQQRWTCVTIATQLKQLFTQKISKSHIRSLIVGDSINNFLGKFLYINYVGLTVYLKIVNVSGFKLTGISSTFLHQLSNTSSQITCLYTSPKHRFTCSSEEDIIQSSCPSGLGSFICQPVHFSLMTSINFSLSTS